MSKRNHYVFAILLCIAQIARVTSAQGRPDNLLWLRGGDYIDRWQSALFRDNAALLTSTNGMGGVKLRNISDGSIIWTLNTGLSLYQTTVSPNGQYLATVGGIYPANTQNVVRLWRTSDRTLLWTKNILPIGGYHVSFSPNSSRLCCPSNGKIWAIPSGAETNMSDPPVSNADPGYIFPNGAMDYGYWLPSSASFAVPTYDGRGGTRYYDGVTGAVISKAYNSTMTGLSPSGDYHYYVGTLSWLGFRGMAVLDPWVIPPHDPTVLAGVTTTTRPVEYADSRWVGNSVFGLTTYGSLYPYSPPFVEKWDVPASPWSLSPYLTGQRFTDLPSGLVPTGLDGSPDQTMISVTGMVGFTSLVDVYRTTDYIPGSLTPPFKRFIDHTGVIYSMSFSARSVGPYGHILATGDGGGIVFLWSALTGQKLNPDHPILHFQHVNTVSISPDGQTLVIGAEPQYGAIGAIWDISDPANPHLASPGLNDGKMTDMFGDIAEIVAATFSPDGTLIATRTIRGAVGLWKRDPVTGIFTERQHLDGDSQGHGGSGLAFSPDGKRLAAGAVGTTPQFKIYNVSYTGPSLTELMVSNQTGQPIAFSPDGTKLAFAGTGNVTVRDVSGATPTLNVIWTSADTGGPYYAVAWEPCGKYIVAGNQDTASPLFNSRFRFLRAADGVQTKYYSDEVGNGDQPIRSVLYSPDGQYIAYGRGDATVGFFPNPYYAAPKLASVTASPTSVPGGAACNGTVTLDCFAPIGDAAVSLSSSNPAAASVPPSVAVGVGTKSRMFPITTAGVAVNTSVTITAVYNGITKTKVITVTPPALSSVALNPASVTGGATLTGTANMTGTAAVDTTITLGSANAKAHVPASVIVTAGNSSASFNITTDVVTGSVMGSITASANGISKSAVLTVKPAVLTTLGISTNSVFGGTSVTGTVSFGAVVPTETTVTLTSANAKAHVPVSVVVPAGSTSATFNITTDPTTANTAGAITAAFGSVSKSATLTVKAPTYLSFTLTPATVVGGDDVVGLVTMAGPVAVDTVVSLTNANSKAVLPGATVTILAGTSSVSFTITTLVTGANVSGAVKAQVSSVTKSVTLKVTP